MAENGGSRKPADTAFRQQRLPAWQPILTPNTVIGFFLAIGTLFLILGIVIQQASDSIVEKIVQYDGSGTNSAQSDCKLSNGGDCQITFTAPEKMEAPIYVYYQIDNFYQNHRKYVASYNEAQLLGEVYTDEDDVETCSPLYKNGSSLLSPCGVIANSLFNDKITLAGSSVDGLKLKTTNIAWPSDKDKKFAQPSGFKSKSASCSLVSNCIGSYCTDEVCTSLGLKSNCKGYNCSDPDYYNCEKGCHATYYPSDDEVQYLYETFPEVVSPMLGVKDEHFIVWMRVAALPTFRKLYGRIMDDIPKGGTVTFDVDAEFWVNKFKGKKYLIITTASFVGGKNSFLYIAYLVVGSFCLAAALAFAIKIAVVGPRKLGDTSLLE